MIISNPSELARFRASHLCKFHCGSITASGPACQRPLPMRRPTWCRHIDRTLGVPQATRRIEDCWGA